LHACAGRPQASGAVASSPVAAAGAAAGGHEPAGASIGSAMGAAPMGVCKKATPGKSGASWQQQCAGDMDARFGDGNDSDVKYQRSFLDPSHRQQETLSCQRTRSFLGEGPPPPEPFHKDGEGDFWDDVSAR
jgi:hypothetical protein